MKNNKGFTLVELLATIIILGVVVGIAGYSITTIIKNAREKDLEILKDNIRAASELYYQECKYAKSENVKDIDDYNNKYCAFYEVDTDKYIITLNGLVRYGFLKGNSEGNDMTLINPVDKVPIDGCTILISYSNKKINVESKTNTESCPTFD